MKYFEIKDTGVNCFASRATLTETRDNFVMIATATDAHYILGKNTNSKCLDVENARKTGYSVFRDKYASTGKYSVRCMQPATLYIFITLLGEYDLRDIFLNSLLDGCKEKINYIDKDRRRGTCCSLLKNGRMFACIDQNITNNHTILTGGVMMDIDYSMYDRVSIPDSSFKGKVSDTIRNRIIGLREVVPDLSTNDLKNHIKEKLANQLPSLVFEDSKMTDAEKEKKDNIASIITSDWEIFKK